MTDPADTTPEDESPAPEPVAETPAGEEGEPEAPVSTDWPEDWRDRLANGDDKLLKRLGRFRGPEGILDWALNAEKKISSGQVREPFPEDGTHEERAQWRRQNGIPADPADYPLPDGIAIGENDRPLIDMFLDRMHAHNADPALVRDAVDTYYEIQDTVLAERAERDAQAKADAEQALREELGGDYRRFMWRAVSVLDTAPEELKGLLMGARLADGSPLGSHVPALHWLHHLATEMNPAATVVPGTGGDEGQAVDTELAELRGLMADRQSRYYHGPDASKLQAHYRDLITTQDKMAGRGRRR